MYSETYVFHCLLTKILLTWSNRIWHLCFIHWPLLFIYHFLTLLCRKLTEWRQKFDKIFSGSIEINALPVISERLIFKILFYKLFWTQACPEGVGTNGTHRSHARCHPYPIPQPVKVGHTTGVYVPYSFQTVVWVFLRPTRTDQWKCCETGPTNRFSSLSEKTRKSNHLQMSLQKQHFLLSYLKTLSVGSAGIWTRDLLLSRPALSQLS